MPQNPNHSPRKPFGSHLRNFLRLRGIKQKVVAERVGIAEGSMSQILNGHSRPHRATLERIIEEMEATEEEQRTLWEAYGVTSGISPALESRENLDRAKRLLGVKALAATFADDVKRELDKTNQFFERSYRRGSVICDFLLPGPPRIGIECKLDPSSDWELTASSVQLLKNELNLETAVVVVPYQNDATHSASDAITQNGGMIVSVEDLEVAINLLFHDRRQFLNRSIRE